MSAKVKECLQPILKKDISDDIVNYILTIEQEDDFRDFMENIVDRNNRVHLEMYEKLKRIVLGKTNERIQETRPNNQQMAQQGSAKNQGRGKKTKYHNFYGQDNKAGLLKGRHPCDCQATKHELVNNCTKCGRIVCEQEGSGPCFFCDNMVCTRYEMDILATNTKQSDALYNKLVDQKKSKEWKRAIENRNRLIKTDQLGVVKNKVYDDENDYFDSNSGWLANEEKSTLKKKYRSTYEMMHRSRRDMKVALDFASRTVIVDSEEQAKNKQHLLKGVNKLLDKQNRFPANLFDGDKGELVAEIVRLMEQSSIGKQGNVSSNEDKKQEVTASSKYRIANADFLESVDTGMCLSMHQPWASLLVAGIKIHEGRTWKTEHRGRLWIAAAAKEPEDEEILECEEMYRRLYNDPTMEFPKKYPTGCLLGCVFVEDCLSQSDYRQKYPDGESNSPYVFVCSGPVILPVFYPMQGQHKIFPLPKELHRTAKAALMSSKWI